MEKNELLKQADIRMEGAINSFIKHLRGIRAGRASPEFVEPVQVEAYEQRQQIARLVTITTPDARTIVIQPWDKGLLKSIQKAIVEANLGLMPVVDGNLIRINLPSLSEERRKELIHVASKYAEEAKVAVRNVRRDIIADLKKIEHISEDEVHSLSNKLQTVTDDFTSKINKILEDKKKEISSI